LKDGTLKDGTEIAGYFGTRSLASSDPEHRDIYIERVYTIPEDGGSWIAVDTQGPLLGVVVHAADIQDADGLRGLLERLKPLYCWLRAVFADGIYDRVAALLACFLFGLTLIAVRRAAGAAGFVVQPRRWVGGGEDTGLARPMAPAGQGLRGTARGLRGHGHPRRDPPHAPPRRPPEPQTPPGSSR
ncbi:MAG: DUF6338 family protein, partial [Geminicoccaceae bacterium]